MTAHPATDDAPTVSASRLLVVGDAFVDYSADVRRVRLGGIFHAARALDALGTTYALAYVAPSYLEGSIRRFARELGAAEAVRVGLVDGSPHVIIARESTEAGDQGYEEILRDQTSVAWDPTAWAEVLETFRPTDVLIVPGRFPVADALMAARTAGAATHMDAQYDADVPALAAQAGGPFATVFMSTSAAPFRDAAGEDPTRLRALIHEGVASTLVLKENRGGSRAMSSTGTAEAPAFPTDTAHSIGVGDCFDCAWLTARTTDTPEAQLTRASYYAGLYAGTWSHVEFRAAVRAARRRHADVVAQPGVRLPWERRRARPVYLAAPDFPDVDTGPLDALDAALRYHGFAPRRPVRENGLYRPDMSRGEARTLYAADLSILYDAGLVVAVALTADPGTFTELGVAAARGTPTILWDPRGLGRNLFAAHTAGRVCASLSEVIDATFELFAAAAPEDPNA